MAEFVKGGTSRSERTSSASTRPRASNRGVSWASRTAMRERIRSRAWATVRRGGLGLAIVPVTVFELGPAAFAVGDDVLVETGSDHLVSHRTGDSKLGEGLDLVGHDLVACTLDGGDHVIDGGTRLGSAAGSVLGSDLRGDLGLRLLGGFCLSVFGLFGHRINHLTNWDRTQAETLKRAASRLAFTRSIVNRNVSLASAVTGAARNIPIKPNNEAPNRVLKMSSSGCTRVKRPMISGAKTWLSTCWATSAKTATKIGSGLPGPACASASTTARVPQISGPKKGTASRKKAMTPTSRAIRKPSSQRPRVATTPMNTLVKSWPRTYSTRMRFSRVISSPASSCRGNGRNPRASRTSRGPSSSMQKVSKGTAISSSSLGKNENEPCTM